MTAFSKRITLTLGAAAVAMGLGAAVYAAVQDDGGRPERPPFARRGGPDGPGPFGRGGPDGPGGLMLEGLDLTDAQREQVRAIAEARRAANEPLVERARTAREALNSAMRTRPVDEAAIRTRHAELAVVEADLAVSQARTQAEIYGLLTPEQQSELDERREQMSERRGEFRGRRGR